MSRPARATAKDVARASGVSQTTVSFVLNGAAGHVSQETRERVRQAARELGYVPNGSAQALRKGASRIVLLNIEGIPTGSSLGSYIRGLDAELAAHQHVLLVLHGHLSSQALSDVAQAVSARAVIDLGDAGRADVIATGASLDVFSAQADVPVRYLVDRGHRHIANAMPDTPELQALAGLRERLIRQATRTAGLADCPALVLPASLGAAEDRLRAFRAEHPEVTAVLAYNDDLALVTLAAMRNLGLRAPEDLAVVGFDDTPHGALFSPALTTVHIDAEAIGRIAARSALGLPAPDTTPEPARVIVRQSA
ncbi:DNA-binding LacI/PurR family transcriptional regulator [Streptomyces phaeochromogenes]|uniref:LacI family DNA-binding transcriptional regulator n=1 Tax=Streptomyces TaxID=1883 RepID=UPI002792E17F|nr:MULTISPECIES: LacI family DNA-binding transcriptional regulator [Streptomyces]MDQ0954741.1 DNA-binding LacI/PurR family transcriptional regulator [Streptomyces phaeochromogenes]